MSGRELVMEYLLFSALECDYVRRQMNAAKPLGMERVIRGMGKVKVNDNWRLATRQKGSNQAERSRKGAEGR